MEYMEHEWYVVNDEYAGNLGDGNRARREIFFYANM